MLRTRIITAIVLFSVFFVALFYLPPSGWLIFATLIAVLAAWEWGAFMTLGKSSRLVAAAGMFFVCLVIVTLQPVALGLEDGFAENSWVLGRWFYIPATAFWLFVVPLWMKRRWMLPKSSLGLVVGMILILPTWLALVQLRHANAYFLIAVMATVWLADIGAYFFGRALGRHKLAPTISPGKTWEGAVGGGLTVIVYGFSLSPRLPAFFSGNYVLLLLVLVLVTVVSVIGDLYESLLKRQAGLKDSSAVLPGHGGVLDRIDSLTSTLPLVALVFFSDCFGAL